MFCAICGCSTRVEEYGLQFGTLRASGYGSAHDGEHYEVLLCEPCFFRTISGFRRERMVNFVVSDEDQAINNFGRVTWDVFSMTAVSQPLEFNWPRI